MGASNRLRGSKECQPPAATSSALAVARGPAAIVVQYMRTAMGGSSFCGGGDGDGNACQTFALWTPPSPVAVLWYRVLPQYTMHPTRTLLVRATGRKRKLSPLQYCAYGTVLEVASLRPALIASSLPLLLRCGPAHRPTMLDGLRLRGRAPVARRRVPMLLAEEGRHHWTHASRVSHPRIVSAPVIRNPALHLPPGAS